MMELALRRNPSEISTDDENNRNMHTIMGLALDYRLNPVMAVNQKISVANLKRLRLHHIKMDRLIKQANEIVLIDDEALNKIKDILSEIEQVEFLMQDEWGFERSRQHHTHWSRVIHCSCKNGLLEAYINDDWGQRIQINHNCKVHNIR